MAGRAPLAAALLAAATLAAAPAARAGLAPPLLDFSLGGTFATTGTPGGGGASASLSPMWPAGDRARFGLAIFADDIGTQLASLRDVNSGAFLGTVATDHRWAFGAGWRGDADVVTRGRWSAAATGTWGYWRVEDDRRGTTFAAAGAVGFTLGAIGRVRLAPAHTLGLALRYHRLFPDRASAYVRTERYASASLVWGWGRTDER